MTSRDTQTVADIGEFDLIDRLRTAIPGRRSSVTLGIGDDAAVWQPADGMANVITTDALVEGIHFRLDWTDWRSLGHKALAVNLSDIAAMGARPILATVTLGLRGRERVIDLVSMYEGMGALATFHDVDVAGGDIVRSPDALFIGVTVIGEVERGQVLTRSGAKAGDAIVVSGTIGASAAGMALLAGPITRRSMSTAPLLIAAHLRPNPRIALGRVLFRAGVTATMDLSDGLLGDLPKILVASGASAELWTDRVPILPAVHALFPEHAGEFALRGGEDYELLMAIPESRMDHLIEIVAAVGATVTRIGTMIGPAEDGPHIERIDRNGARQVIRGGAFDHFGSESRADHDRYAGQS